MVKSIIIFLFFILIEPIKRILSPILYIVAYLFRDKMRNKRRILWKGYLHEPKRGLLSFLFWLLLDDSIHMEDKQEYDDKEKHYPKWVWKIQNEFLLSWWWSAIRNSFVNWNNWNAYKLGKFQKIINAWGEESLLVLKDKCQGYRLELRQFEQGKRLYLEFYLFNRWFQFGNISIGRFEISIFKSKHD